jgi:hypothetical protein
MRPLTAVVALSAAVLITGPSRAVETVGVPICDEFLAKYEACVKEKMPAEQRGVIADSISQMRASWREILSSSPQSRGELENTCRQSMDSMKASLSASYGCSF